MVGIDPSANAYVYVVKCSDDSYYTGWTTDVGRRLGEHQAQEGAKYTRGRTPVELVHVESYESRSEAMSRECAIKRMSRSEKEKLIHESDASYPQLENEGPHQ
ncbi:MAG: GIY-YIG nuclease family protein [Halobacteriaceae archaeon]